MKGFSSARINATAHRQNCTTAQVRPAASNLRVPKYRSTVELLLVTSTVRRCLLSALYDYLLSDLGGALYVTAQQHSSSIQRPSCPRRRTLCVEQVAASSLPLQLFPCPLLFSFLFASRFSLPRGVVSCQYLQAQLIVSYPPGVPE